MSHGAVFVGLHVAMDECFAEEMQVLHDGGHMDEIPDTVGTHEVRFQLPHFDPCGVSFKKYDVGLGLGELGTFTF